MNDAIEKRTEIMKIRVSPEEKKTIQKKAGGPRKLSEYVRDSAMKEDGK